MTGANRIPKPLAFFVPAWRPTKMNEIFRMHWRERGKRKKSDVSLIAHYFRESRLPPAECKRRVSVTIILKPRGKEGDDDGLWKFLLDGLVACGALIDDSRQWVEQGSIEYERGTAETWGSRITIEDV